jgi:hypothetical protein
VTGAFLQALLRRFADGVSEAATTAFDGLAQMGAAWTVPFGLNFGAMYAM